MPSMCGDHDRVFVFRLVSHLPDASYLRYTNFGTPILEMTPQLKPIEPKSTRWEPTADPNDIVVPGLDTAAPVNDQVEQIEQLITIKLQVRYHRIFSHDVYTHKL